MVVNEIINEEKGHEESDNDKEEAINEASETTATIGIKRMIQPIMVGYYQQQYGKVVRHRQFSWSVGFQRFGGHLHQKG